MNSQTSVEAAIDPANRLTFLLDWEVTMKCNLDCPYCGTGLYGGHDNSQLHPELHDCLNTIDFMYQYVDAVMKHRIRNLRHVVLNVYGGESLNHPHITEILVAAREKYQYYCDKWGLTVSTTTNAIVSRKKFQAIADLVDEFTVSWHSTNTEKQKALFRNNLLYLKSKNKSVKCVVLMHPKYFDDAQQQITWCKENSVRYLPRQLDHPVEAVDFNYQSKQMVWFENLYQKKLQPVIDIHGNADLASTGRACCGGRKLCSNGDYKNTQRFVNNKFSGWYCSVDRFFLYIKQVNGEVYVNKDCKMNYTNSVGPIGHLSNAEALIQQIGQTPDIQCAKARCYCGLCAPKAASLEDYRTIVSKYELKI